MPPTSHPAMLSGMSTTTDGAPAGPVGPDVVGADAPDPTWSRAVAWLEDTLGGRVVGATRQPRWRPAWFCDLQRPDGTVLPIYWRGDRGLVPGSSPLRREADVITALEAEGIPVPHVHGFCPDPAGIAMERVAGDPDFHRADAAWKSSGRAGRASWWRWPPVARHRPGSFRALGPAPSGHRRRPRAGEPAALGTPVPLDSRSAGPVDRVLDQLVAPQRPGRRGSHRARARRQRTRAVPLRGWARHRRARLGVLPSGRPHGGPRPHPRPRRVLSVRGPARPPGPLRQD